RPLYNSISRWQLCAQLLKEENGGGVGKPSFVEFAYYQSFCNVDTSQVLQRIMWSMVPVSGRNSFLNLHIKNNPDLYGPFWISITLILSIAISSNIADYLSSAGKTNHIWHYDFHKVTIAAITIFSYIFLLPLVLFSLLKYNTMRGVRYTLLEILCAYGYSIFIYIPISILWVIQVPALQWTLVIVGALLSGSVLVKNFWPVLRHTNIKVMIIIVVSDCFLLCGMDVQLWFLADSLAWMYNCGSLLTVVVWQVGALVLVLILTFHTLLAASFVLYFFKPAPHYGESLSLPEIPGSLPEVAGSIPDVPAVPIDGNDQPEKKLPPSGQQDKPPGKDEPPGKEVVSQAPSPDPTSKSEKPEEPTEPKPPKAIPPSEKPKEISKKTEATTTTTAPPTTPVSTKAPTPPAKTPSHLKTQDPLHTSVKPNPLTL
ncbi:YIPF1, partial [Cordylochernes scorpioides]